MCDLTYIFAAVLVFWLLVTLGATASDRRKVKHGTASWYGQECAGRLMAKGVTDVDRTARRRPLPGLAKTVNAGSLRNVPTTENMPWPLTEA